MHLKEQGFSILPSVVSAETLEQLRHSLFQGSAPGERCLLDDPLVHNTSLVLKQQLCDSGFLDATAVAIQAITFNKTVTTNWKVNWHQDLMFPFANRVSAQAFDLPTIKEGVHYARPPEQVLNQLLAVRLHLDDCDGTNGPLRVSPGTHRAGILRTAEIPGITAIHGEIACLAAEGDLLLMRPLCLHASSQATEPKNRRVLHFVYFCGGPITESWHRSI